MTPKEIIQNPKLPPQIIEAINNDKFAIFFGAGASRLIGCSSWKQLAEKLIERCYKTPKKNDTKSFCINFKEREDLLEMKDPKKIITICQHILNKNLGSDDDFIEEIRKSLEPRQDLIEQNIYDELFGLRGVFITTNIDVHFDQKFHPSRIVIQKGDFDPEKIESFKLYHVHGSISDFPSVILTVKQYIERYKDDKQFKAFLNRIFDGKVVLFIGYGLNEFEILDFLITSSGMSVSEEPKHFILLPYYRGQDTILEWDVHYFSQMGIAVIPYSKDDKGYAQLLDVIKSWKSEILYQSHFLHDKFEKLKMAANNYDPIIEGETLQLIKNDKPLENEFFRQLSKTDNPYPWVKPLKSNGYFNPSNNPVPSAEYGLYWNIMGVLENVAKSNNIQPTNEITDEIVIIIDSITDYKDEKGQRIKNILTDRLLIRVIFLLPLKEINEHYLDFIRICMHTYHERILIAGEIGESVIPRLLENNDKHLLIKLLDILFDFEKTSTPTFEQYPSVLGQYYLSVVLEKYSEKIIRLCELEAIDITLQKIDSIVADDQRQFYEVWIPSIKNEDEFKERYDSQLIHFIWKGFKILGPIKIKKRINELLKKEHPIFKRIAICAIDENFNDLQDLFWEWGVNPLDEYHLKRELYEFLNNHCQDFSQKELKKIVNWIETKSYHEDRLSADTNVEQKYLAKCKKEWLLSLLPRNDPDILALYKKYDSINPVEIQNPGRSIVIGHFSESVSPITKEDLLEKNNLEIVQYLNNFKDDEKGWGKVSAHSLCAVFRMCITENPQKFVQDLDPFFNLKRPYQHELFLGLTEAWRAGNNFKWDGIFRFINSIIKSKEFWEEIYVEGTSNYRNWIISRIAVLIEEGTKEDSHLFELELLPEAENILLHLARDSESDLYNMGELVTSVLNSKKGIILSAMINYSLCFARHYRKDVEKRWIESIEKDFEKRLNPVIEPSVEFSVILGQYLTNLCYLDREWVKTNINRIFSKENEVHWNAAFTGYLFYSNWYADIYKLLMLNGHYSKALDTEFKDPNINERLIQHICIGYLEGLENLDDEDSLIHHVLDTWKSKQIIELIHFLSWYGQKITPEKRHTILPLWRIIFSRSSQNEKDSENTNILSELNEWISLTDELDDESCSWLKISVRYIKPYEFNFIKQLIRHSEKRPKCAGEIYLSMIEMRQFLDFQDTEDILKFVTILYDKKEKNLADAICNRFLEVGIDFLKPVYEQNIG